MSSRRNPEFSMIVREKISKKGGVYKKSFRWSLSTNFVKINGC